MRAVLTDNEGFYIIIGNPMHRNKDNRGEPVGDWVIDLKKNIWLGWYEVNGDLWEFTAVKEDGDLLTLLKSGGLQALGGVSAKGEESDDDHDPESEN